MFLMLLPDKSKERKNKSHVMFRRCSGNPLVAARGIMHASAPSGSATKDTSAFPQNWNMMSQSQAKADELVSRSMSNAKEKIPDHTLRPQESVPASGKYHTVDPTIKQDYEKRLREEEAHWRQSVKGRGAAPVPNPQNSLEYGMRRRIRVVDEGEKKDPWNLEKAFEVGNLAMRK